MPIRFTVYPDECDAFGHLNQASYLALFERARWRMLAEGPGMHVFAEAGVWPAARRATIDYFAGAWPGDELEFETELVGRGRTSFTVRQRAIRVEDRRLVATLETVFVCIDRDERPTPPPDVVLTALAPPPSRCTTPRGIELAFIDQGEGDIPLVLLHGFPLDRTLWLDQLLAITDRRVIVPDLRGFGDSPPSPVRYTIDDLADDIAALLDHLGVARAVVAGLSMGGYVALAMADRHPDRLAGLVLMSTRADADDDAVRTARDGAIAAIGTEGGRAVARGIIGRLFGADAPEGIRNRILARTERLSDAALVGATQAMRDRPDRTTLLPAIACPTLVVHGDADGVIAPSHATAMAEAIPGAELVMIEGAGHLPPVESPTATSLALQTFHDRIM